jgi:diguanylate cyclase (GGDEF)-like protein/putative nucleotidyltransferase with HDIG domain
VSLRQKAYLFIWAGVAAAAAAIAVVVKAVLVGADQWAGSTLALMFAVIGVVVVLAAAMCALLEVFVFRRVAQLAVEAGKVGAPLEGAGDLKLVGPVHEHEQGTRTLAEALEELQLRHSDLETAYCQLQQLQEASVSLGSSLDISDALVQLEDAALGIFDAEEVWVLRLNAEEEQLVGMRAFSDHPEGYSRLPGVFGCWGPQASIMVQSKSLISAVMEDRAPIFIESVTEMPSKEIGRLFDGEEPDLGGFHSLVAIPLVADGIPVGLALSASALPTKFSEDRRATILLFAARLAQALENNRMYEETKAMGEVDSLSGLHDRHRALEQLDVEIARARRYEGTFSILLADIDNFKNFNETWGHAAGDDVIKRVAAVLRRRNRTTDFVGRYGGDEFLMVLPATTRTGAATVADHIRLALGSQPYTAPNGYAVPLRLSFGAAAFPEDGNDSQSLIAIADANLYESKRWGGDTVTLRRETFGAEVIDASGFSTLDALVNAVDNKDHYTRKHSAHVAEYSASIVESLGFSKDKQEVLRVAALLHDVGKIGLPDRILRKPGPLTHEEEDAVRQHSLLGSLMVSQHMAGNEEVREAVLHHHERWDGSGYPAGLSGRNISMLGRILAVADAYSAMTTDRPYRAGLSLDTAIEELKKGSGKQFDPEVVSVFLTCFQAEEKQPAEPAVSS